MRSVIPLTVFIFFLLPQIILAQEEKGDSLFPVCLNGKYGFININGELMIKAKYDSVKRFSYGVAPVYKKGKGWGIINHKAHLVKHYKYQDIGIFSSGVSVIEIPRGEYGTAYGVMDVKGKVVVKPRKGEIRPFYQGYATAIIAPHTIDSVWGVIDRSGRVIMPSRFANYEGYRGRFANGFSFQYTTCCAGQQGGFFDIAGINRYPYNYYSQFNDGLAVIGLKDHLGFIDTTFKMVIPPTYSFVSADDHDDQGFSEGICFAYADSLWKIIDKHGAVLRIVNGLDMYPAPSKFHEGLAAVCKNKLWGFVNAKGEFVIQPRFNSVFSEGDGWEEKFCTVGFHDGLAAVELDGKMVYINKKGLVVWQVE